MSKRIHDLHLVTEKDAAPSGVELVLMGKKVRLKIEACFCGIVARWVMRTKVFDTMPPEIQSAVKAGIAANVDINEECDKILMEWHFEPTWYERLFRVGPERALTKWIRQTKRDLSRWSKSESELPSLRTRMETRFADTRRTP